MPADRSTPSATLADVARRAGVSLATASRALNGSATRQVGEALRARVQQAAADYVGRRPRPSGMTSWGLGAGTGTPDGRLAVVRMSGVADVPLVGWLLGDGVAIDVVSRARADLE